MEFIGYFTQWSIYGRQVFPRTIDDNGIAERLTILNYAYQNITSGDLPVSETNPEGYQGYRFFEEVRSFDDKKQEEADGYINAGDAGADYLTPFNAEQKKPSIGADDPGWGAQTLMGNFNQLKLLKAKRQHLKVLVSLGGWTFCRNWSAAASTGAGREELVRSCIDLFIKGNLPSPIWTKHWQTGKLTLTEQFHGSGVAAGIFDGVDIDWEWPGSEKGLHGNKVDKEHDRANFLALLKEFRKQLDDPQLVKDFPPRGGKYLLTAFLPADPEIMKAGWDAAEVMKLLDFGNIQGYDFHGAWEKTTNQQSALRSSTTDHLSVDASVEMWIEAAGESARSKLTIGVPYYGRGWSNVGQEHGDGMLNSAGGAATGKYQAGVDDYREIARLDATRYPVHYRKDAAGNPEHAWRYSKEDKVLWTYDDPSVAYRKAVYAKEQKLGGVMAFSLDGDDEHTGILTQHIRAGLDGQKPPSNGVKGV
ncbi:glycoside hydrolase family 18 protein [Kitasatospora sp. NPDC101447]|uniref:glycoside hydrolase family 18 protein n=1 Tax=Kitasatospora sp. NPDC101447 TaxID=3364102 RepID=UPI003813F4AE